MHGHVPVALLEPVVLRDVVKVVAADHHGVLHLQEAVGVKLRIILSNTCQSTVGTAYKETECKLKSANFITLIGLLRLNYGRL